MFKEISYEELDEHLGNSLEKVLINESDVYE